MSLLADMNTNTLLTIAAALGVLSSAAMADITPGQAIVPNMTAQMRGNCDLMASNTIRATFKGMRELPMQTLDESQPASVQVAEFEVIENLAHRRYVRYGDGKMPAGMRFTVALDRELPGQPADVVDKVGQMKPGDEAVMKVDHLFLFAEPEGRNLRPCTRMAVRPSGQQAVSPEGIQPLTPSSPQAADSVLPFRSERSRSVSASFSLRPDGKGGLVEERVETQTEYDSASGKRTTRMFINGQEVDPETRKPLSSSAQAPATAAPAPLAPTPAPQPAASPAAPSAPSGIKDDTVVEKPALPAEEGF